MTTDTNTPIGADALSRDTIRAIFLAHGFTVKEGQTDLKPYVYEAAEALVRAALASAAQPAAVPPGYVLVPVEPTPTMIGEGSCATTLPGPRYITDACALECWRLMLAAAPKAAPNPAAQGDALTALIERYGRVVFERCRVGHAKGAIRWDIELGYCGLTASGATLGAAIDAARAAKEGGADVETHPPAPR